MKTIQQHNLEVERIAKNIKRFSKLNTNKKLRFYHGGTNSTRTQQNGKHHYIDIYHLSEIIEVNPKEKYAFVEPNVPMDKLISSTLSLSLIPPVVMEFPGITIGGAINGASLESSSFKYGQLNDNCLEYEIVLGNGKIIKASPKEYSDVFYGISGSYGSLGLITLAKIRLVPAKDYVHTLFYPFTNHGDTLSFIKKSLKETDYIEGIIFNKRESVIILGKFSDLKDLPIKTYSKATDPWFYETARKVVGRNKIHEELIPIKDYLFRYNRGAFWTGEYVFPLFHIPNNKLTRIILNPIMNTRKLYDGLYAFNISQRYFLQDFYCPFNKVLDFIKYNNQKLGIYPIWLCPIKPTRTPQKLSPHHIGDGTLIDIGIWGQTEKYLDDPIGVNRDFEKYSQSINARKMLYAHAYYTQSEFWNIYDKNWYNSLRKKYNADKIFPDVWEKVHTSEKYQVKKWKGAFEILIETLKGKNLNS